MADKEEIAALAAWTVRWLQQLTGHSECSTLYGVISDQTALSIIGDLNRPGESGEPPETPVHSARVRLWLLLLIWLLSAVLWSRAYANAVAGLYGGGTAFAR